MCTSLQDLQCYTSEHQRVYSYDICVPTCNYKNYIISIYIPFFILCLVTLVFKLKEKITKKKHKQTQCDEIQSVHIVIEPDESLSISY